MTSYWVGIASQEHVKNGVKEGIAQVCHGKPGPLRKMKPGDWLIYYSPTEKFREKGPYQKFTAIGQVLDRAPYQYAMSNDFIPWRRAIAYKKAQEVPIKSILNALSFIKNKQYWGMVFRRGLFQIPEKDFVHIAEKMEAL